MKAKFKQERKSAAGGDETSEKTHNKGNLVEKNMRGKRLQTRGKEALFLPFSPLRNTTKRSDATGAEAVIRHKVPW